MTRFSSIVYSFLVLAALSACSKQSASPTSQREEEISNGNTDNNPYNSVVETKPAIVTPRVASISGAIHGFGEALPTLYDSTTKNYPLIIFLHGQGDIGNGTTDIYKVGREGIGKMVKNKTFPANFNVQGKNYSFIVLLPQFDKWADAGDVNSMLDYAVKNYRVDQTRIYVVGFSMGGGITWLSGASITSKIAAIVPISSASAINDKNAEALSSSKMPVWAFHNSLDTMVSVTYTKNNVAKVDALNPPIKPLLTLFNSQAHDAWNKACNPGYKENSMNIYEWMLQYTR